MTDGKILARHRKVHLFDINVPGRIVFKESDTLSAGDQVTVVSTPYGKIGVGICYDIRFPEVSDNPRRHEKKKNTFLPGKGKLGIFFLGKLVIPSPFLHTCMYYILFILFCYVADFFIHSTSLICFLQLSMLMRKKGCSILFFPGAFNLTTGPAHWELLQRARAVDNQLFVAAVSPARNPDSDYQVAAVELIMLAAVVVGIDNSSQKVVVVLLPVSKKKGGGLSYYKHLLGF